MLAAVEVQQAIDLPDDVDPDVICRLVSFALEQEKAVGPWQVTILLTDDERMRQLHRDFMGLDSPTDVMTFSDGAEPGAGAREVASGGDIAISVERAADQAPRYRMSLRDEVLYLVLHGLLHLLGWNDETNDARAAMLVRQTELLAAFDRAAWG